MYPIPPVIITHNKGGASLIAQSFVSSYPAAGLVFLGPPVHPLSESFIFELKFPIAILATSTQFESMKGERYDDAAVDKLILPQGKEDFVDGQDAITQIELWLDDLGI